METKDADKFGEILGSIANVFEKQPSDSLTLAYFTALEDLPIGAIEKAAGAIIRTGKFFPKPAEIRELCEGSLEDQIQNAWNLLNKAYRKAGEMDSVCFQDAAMAYAMQKTFTTWTNCANELYTLSDEMIANRKRTFATNYKIGQRTADQSTPLYFPGKAECSNRQSVGKWNVQMAEYWQPVYLVSGDDVIEKRLPFSGSTGQLTASGARQLEAFREGRQIEATKYRLITAGEKAAAELDKAAPLAAREADAALAGK